MTAKSKAKARAARGDVTVLKPAAARERGERGLVGLFFRVAVYFAAGIICELLLAAWWRLLDGERA